jgi:Protein of unknown function (DUF3303)
VLFLVIERFKERDAKAVYRRLREEGRGAPDGLRYVGSWIEANFDRCFQLMECDDAVSCSSGSRSGAIWSSSRSCRWCRRPRRGRR